MPNTPVVAEKTAIEVSNLNFFYGTFKGLKDINYDINNSNLYVQNQGTEDWKGLLQGIEFARIPNKEKVVEIIRNPSLSSTEKQGQLRAMTEAWEIITEEYLPPLRRFLVDVRSTWYTVFVQPARSSNGSSVLMCSIFKTPHWLDPLVNMNDATCTDCITTPTEDSP